MTFNPKKYAKNSRNVWSDCNCVATLLLQNKVNDLKYFANLTFRIRCKTRKYSMRSSVRVARQRVYENTKKI